MCSTVLTLVDCRRVSCCGDGSCRSSVLWRCGREVGHTVVERVRHTILVEDGVTVNCWGRCCLICTIEWLLLDGWGYVQFPLLQNNALGLITFITLNFGNHTLYK